MQLVSGVVEHALCANLTFVFNRYSVESFQCSIVFGANKEAPKMAGRNRISQHDVFIVCVPPKFHCLIYLNRYCYCYLLKCSARAEHCK